MIRISTLFLVMLMLGMGGSALHAEPYMDSDRIACVQQAQEHLFNDRFAQVDSIYAGRVRDYPGDPLGYVLRAGGLFAEMTDREENLHEEQFLDLLEATDSLTTVVIDTCDAATAAWMYLFRGLAKTYQALWEARFGSLMSSLRLGLSTVDEYEAGLAVDSGLYDLYTGSGSYHYWKSVKVGVLKYVGLFKDEKEQGIVELRLAADSSLLHREVARSALIWIWLEEREYDSAAVLAGRFVERYPEGKAFRWPMAQARYRQQEYERAAAAYEEIRALLVQSPGNYYNLIQCDYYITQCYSWSEQPVRAVESARNLKHYDAKIPKAILRRQAAKINYLRRMARRSTR